MTQTSSRAAAGNGTRTAAPLVLVGAESGITLIPSPTPLTRLNYFDGKFLRADDLAREQDYLRRLVELSNQAGGSGIVHGFDVLRAGAGLVLSAGLAVDPKGRVLYLPFDAGVDVTQLLQRARSAPAGSATAKAAGSPGFAPCETAAVGAEPVTAQGEDDLFLLTLTHAEALCGEEEVYGQLCEEACVTSTQRPYRLEGVVLRAIPLALPAARCTAAFLTRTHRRSQVASAYFADERARLGADVTGARLREDLWCRGAAAETGDSVPLAVLSMNGGAVEFVDPWTARRERMEPTPPRFWQWRTGMRPLAVWWAQLLQFQCHLRDALAGAPAPGTDPDPCAEQTRLLERTRRVLEEMEARFGAGRLRDAGARRDASKAGPTLLSVSDLKAQVVRRLTEIEAASPSDRVLIDAGIAELPAAGYLPVVPGPVDARTQAQRLLGPGVDVRVCAVRPDYVAHAVEEARHMERICLLSGLADPRERPQVDVLVPDGEVVGLDVVSGGLPLEASARIEFLFDPEVGDLADVTSDVLTLEGAARAELLAAGGAAFHFAGTGAFVEEVEPPRDAAGGVTAGGTAGVKTTLGAASRPSGAISRETMRRVFRRVFPRLTAVEGGVKGFQELPPTTQAEPDLPPAVWASARIEHDPFSLRPGDSTPVRAEVALTVEEEDRDGEEGGPEGAEVLLQGELFCDVGGNGSTFLRGRARGFAVLSGEGRPESEFMSAAAELTLALGADGSGQVKVDLAIEERELSFTTTWSASPVQGLVHATIDWIEAARQVLIDAGTAPAEVTRQIAQLEAQHPGLRTLPWGRLDFRHEPEVLRAGNPHHTRAVEALSYIESILDEPGFRERAERLLFPPPTVGEGGGTIRPRLDWVAFHRRRDSSCDCVCAPLEGVLAPAILRYRVFHVEVPIGTPVEEVRARVTGAGPVEGLEALPVLPRFDAGTAILRNAYHDVRDAWPTEARGDLIVYAAIAARPSDDASPAVLDERLDRVGSIFNDLANDSDAVYETLDTVPGALDASGADGVMVFATHPDVLCHRVLGLEEPNEMDEIHAAIEAGTGLEAELTSEGFPMGSVRFVRGTDGVVPADLEAAVALWRAAHPRREPTYTVVIVPEALRDTDITVFRQQGFAINQALGGRGSVDVRFTAQPVFGACEVVTVLEPAEEQACHQVFGFIDGPLTTGGTRYARFRELMAQGNPAAATTLPGVQNLTNLSFNQETDVLSTPSSFLVNAWTTKLGNPPLNHAATVYFSNSVMDQPLQEARTRRIATTLRSGFAAFDATVASPAEFGCGAVTVLVSDGFIVTTLPETTCLRVVAFPGQAMMESVVAAVREGRLAEVLPKLDDLGSAAFQADGTADTASIAAVREKWDTLGMVPARVLLVTAGREISRQLLGQARDVVAALDGPGLTETPLPSAEDVFQGCLGILLIEPEPAPDPTEPVEPQTTTGCVSLFRLGRPVDPGDGLRRLMDTLRGGGLDKVLAESERVMDVLFRDGELLTPPDEVREKAGSASILVPVVAEVNDLAVKEAMVVAEVTGARPADPVATPAALPGPCGTVGLLVTVTDTGTEQPSGGTAATTTTKRR